MSGLTAVAKRKRRMRLGTIIAIPVVSCLVSFVTAPRATAQIQPTAGHHQIHEEMFVPIGGIPQWLTIKGEDFNNPVVLFLHGGPGDAWSPFADSMFAGWDKNFTLVQWDQRGAGRTYSKNGPSIAPTMTVNRMVDDGIEVAEFLTHHLHKKKVILVGGSWGSILGIYMIHARPDMFYAYVGEAQIVNWQKNDAASYARVLAMARIADNPAAISDLTALGPPPWHAVAQWRVFRRWERAYQSKVVTAAPAPEGLSPEYGSPAEQVQYAEADDFSFLHLWGVTLSGPITHTDLPALGTNFAVPIFIIQGQEDMTATPEIAKAYFDSIKAPRKQFYLVPGTGHEPSARELDLVLKVLTEQVRPMILTAVQNPTSQNRDVGHPVLQLQSTRR